MATNHTAKNDAMPPMPEDAAARPAEELDETHAKTGQAQRARPPALRSCKAAQESRRQTCQMEIAALADTTADLPPPWRKQAIRIVRAIVVLFGSARRGLRQPPAPTAADAAAHSPADAADPTTQG